MYTRVAVPSAVLPTRASVQVKDGEDAMSRAGIYDTVKVLESFRLEHSRIEVVLKMPVIYSDTNTIQSDRLEEFRVLVTEEILQKLSNSA